MSDTQAFVVASADGSGGSTVEVDSFLFAHGADLFAPSIMIKEWVGVCDSEMDRGVDT